MAFMGRGGGPSFSISYNIISRNYRYLYRRMNYRIKIDNSYIIMQMISIFIVVITMAVGYFFSYKTMIIDPILKLKNTFITSYIII